MSRTSSQALQMEPLTLLKKPKWRDSWWFSVEDSPEDRRIIAKLDWLLLSFGLLSCWTKYIDQANLNNAYVSGLRDDLGFYGSELVDLQTIYSIGAVLAQIPFMFLIPVIPTHILVPTLDVAWGVITLLQYRANSFAELAVYRFLIGGFQAPFLPAMHFILGSWYQKHEIARRGGIFYVGNTLGTLTASLIQASASATLDNVYGLPGWRWTFILCALLTIPIGISGFFILPGTPDRPNHLFVSKQELRVRKRRLRDAGHATSTEKLTPRVLIEVARKPHFWMLLLLMTFYWNSSLNAYTGGYLLWLKSLERYTTAEMNVLGMISPSVGIFYILIICFASDLLIGPVWAITLAHLYNISGLIIQVIWDVPEPALWFAFITTFSSVSISSVIYGWINHQLRSSPARRSFVLVFISFVAQISIMVFQWVMFPTTEAPRFRKGYAFVLTNSVGLIVLTHVIERSLRRQGEKENRQLEEPLLNALDDIDDGDDARRA